MKEAGKKIRKLLLVAGAGLMLSAAVPVSAAAEAEAPARTVAVLVNDGLAQVADTVIVDGRIYVPAARVAGLLGAKCSWNQGNEELSIHTASEREIVFGNGVPVVYVDGGRFRMDAFPFVKDGRLYVPLRQLSELLGTQLRANEQADVFELAPLTQTAAPAAFAGLKPAEPFKESDHLLLARIAMVEAGNESYEGQLAVANVILNRVKDERFPDSIRGVIYAGKQFPPAHNGLLDRSKPNADALRAARDALNGKNNVGQALYFYNPDVTKGAFWSGLDVVATIGSHRFAR